MRLGSVGQLNSGAAMPISTCLKNTSKSYRYCWTWVPTSQACGRTRYCSMPRPDHNIEKCYTCNDRADQCSNVIPERLSSLTVQAADLLVTTALYHRYCYNRFVNGRVPPGIAQNIKTESPSADDPLLSLH